ncbi:MAG: hypothetical protein U0667_17755 [Chloroflexota bacterium]
MLHHIGLGPGETTTIALRLSESEDPRSPSGPDAAATLAVRAREADAWLEASFPRREVAPPLVRRLAGELLTSQPRSSLRAALDAVALATLDPGGARTMP